MEDHNIKQQLGCWLHERWRTELVLRMPQLASYFGMSWLDLCNRNESLIRSEHAEARVCSWEGTSALTVASVFPAVGGRLMHHCLNQWPICFNQGCVDTLQPDVSVIIAFRGGGRLAQLLCCIATLKSQQDCAIEIIVVEQSWEPLLHDDSIEGVRYFHARSVREGMAFNKSWALNVGARHARSDILVFHDGDMLAPTDYICAVREIMGRGYQAARIPRLVFHPSQRDSEVIQREFNLDAVNEVANVRQNCRGISLAVTRDAYWRIGGHDESFYGWGGEDDEILQRVKTLNMFLGGFMPFVHLWHSWQTEKYSHMIMRKSFSMKKLHTPVAERIAALRAKQCGSMERPAFEEPDW